jgi:hypothetical protein
MSAPGINKQLAVLLSKLAQLKPSKVTAAAKVADKGDLVERSIAPPSSSSILALPSAASGTFLAAKQAGEADLVRQLSMSSPSDPSAQPGSPTSPNLHTVTPGQPPIPTVPIQTADTNSPQPGVDSAFLLTFLSTSFARFEKTVQDGLQANQNAIRANEASIRANQNELESMHHKISAKPASFGSHNSPSNISVSSSGNNTIPPRRPAKTKKASKISKDPFVGEPERIAFLVRTVYIISHFFNGPLWQETIAKHMRRLLGIKSYDELLNLPPPLTTTEIKSYNRGKDDRIVISKEQFRIDFVQPRNSPFNLEAIRIAAEDFLTRVTHDKWYPVPRIPPHYLEQDYVELLMYNHLKYVKSKYSEVKNASQDEKESRLKDAARSSRKTRVCLS